MRPEVHCQHGCCRCQVQDDHLEWPHGRICDCPFEKCTKTMMDLIVEVTQYGTENEFGHCRSVFGASLVLLEGNVKLGAYASWQCPWLCAVLVSQQA